MDRETDRGHRPNHEVEAEGAGRSSVVRVTGVLNGILDVAVRDERLSDNPARGVKLPRKRHKRRTYLTHSTHSQVELLARQDGPHGTLIRLLAYTGLR